MRVVVRGGSVVCKGFVRVFCVEGGGGRLRRGVRVSCVGKIFLGACQVWGHFKKFRYKTKMELSGLKTRQSDARMPP